MKISIRKVVVDVKRSMINHNRFEKIYNKKYYKCENI